MRLFPYLLALLWLMATPLHAETAQRRNQNSDAEKTPTPRPKKKSVPAKETEDEAPGRSSISSEAKPKGQGTPSSKPKADDEDVKAAKKSTPRAKAKSDDDAPKPAKKSTPTPKGKTDDDDDKPAKAPAAKLATPAPEADPAKVHAPSASLSTDELQGYAEQPERVRKLIEAALELAKLNLTYKFGSDDPASGGMDCSGAVSYLLRQQGFKNVPRDSSSQYVWARQHGQFFAVVSKKAGGFEFSDLRPGDLMFWSGTYASADRDPPVTHTMIYLGVQRGRKQQVMWGSSDGRAYEGKQRWGVSVFDFKMPRTDSTSPSGGAVDFLGYARIPGLRDAEANPTIAAVEEKESSSKKDEDEMTPPPKKKTGSSTAKKRTRPAN